MSVHSRIFSSTYLFTKELSGDSKVIIWSIASGEKLFVVQWPFNGAATAASWASCDSSHFVVGFASGDLHLFLSEIGKVMEASLA